MNEDHISAKFLRQNIRELRAEIANLPQSDARRDEAWVFFIHVIKEVYPMHAAWIFIPLEW
jgi:hypothetical protein